MQEPLRFGDSRGVGAALPSDKYCAVVTYSDKRLARLLVELSGERYWSNDLGQYSKKSHRQLFDETLDGIYSNLYQSYFET